MVSEVGSGQIAFFPTFKGMRKSVTTEVDGATKFASTLFNSAFKKVGTDSGKTFGSAFSTTSATSLKQATAEVAKAAREVSAARLKEQDAAGRVRLAEAQLSEARTRFAAGSSQVVRAEERLSSIQRTHTSIQSGLVASTDRLASAQRTLATATSAAADSGVRSSGVFARLPSVFGAAGANSASSFATAFRNNVGAIFTGAALANVVTQAAFSAGRSIGDALSAGVSYSIESVGLASDYEQSTGAIAAVFKDQAETILTAARTAAKSVGISQSAYLKYSTIVGAQLKNLGIQTDQVGGKTNDLITLGADLAAQFGGSTSDAVAALSSLLRGERDPIEKYGVGIKQADINARLAAKGLSELTDEALKQATIQTTLEILWEQTADAQGTFMREQDTYAHKVQVLNAQLEESKTRLGEALLPAFSRAADFANVTLIPAFDNMIDRLGPRLGEALSKAGPEFEALFTKASPLIDKLVLAAAEDGIPSFIRVMEQITDAAPSWAEAFKSITDTDNPLDEFARWFASTDEGSLPSQIREFFEPIHNGIVDRATQGYQESFERLQQSTEKSTTSIGLSFEELEEEFRTNPSIMARTAIEQFRRSQPEAVEAGRNIAKGFADGIEFGRGYATAAARGNADAVIRETKSRLGIQSPSKVMHGFGGDTAQGFALGVRAKTVMVTQAMQQMVSLASLSTSRAASPIVASQAVQPSIDAELLRLLRAWSNRELVARVESTDVANWSAAGDARNARGGGSSR